MRLDRTVEAWKWDLEVPKKFAKQTSRPDPLRGSASSQGGVEASLRLLTGFQRFAWDIGGVACLAFAIITLLALFWPSGGVVIAEVEASEAREAASAWAAGAVVVQRGASQGASPLGADGGKSAVAITAAAGLSKVRAALPPEADSPQAKEGKGVRPLVVLPEDRILAAPRLGELTRALEASSLCDDADENEVIERIMIGSVSHDPGGPYFSMHEHKAVLTRFEKTDVQLAALDTPLACLLLTGGGRPSPYLFDRAQSIGVSVLLTARDTVGAMEALGEAYAGARFGGEAKLARLRELLAEHLDAAALEALLD